MISTVRSILRFQVRYITRAIKLIPKKKSVIHDKTIKRTIKPNASIIPKEKNVQAFNESPIVQKKETPLVDFEVHAQLRSLGKLPEQQLEKELQKDIPSPDILANTIKELPNMLTPSIVSICDLCSKYPKLTKGIHELWVELETNLYNRFNSMTNEHIVTLLSAFSRINKGSPELYKKFQDMIIETEIPFKERQLVSILTSYCQVNCGTPLFLTTVTTRLKKAGKVEIKDGIIVNEPKIALSDLAKAANKLSIMKNNMYGGYGINKVIEKRARATLAENKFTQGELSKFFEYYFGARLGVKELQIMIEQEVVKRSMELEIGNFIKIISALPYYKIRTREFSETIERLSKMWLNKFSDTQLLLLIKAYTNNKTLERTEEFDVMLLKIAIERTITFKARYLAIIAEGFVDYTVSKEGLDAELKERLYNEIEKSARSKIRKFVVHDLIQLQKGFDKAKAGSYTFHNELLSEIWRHVDLFKYKDCINFIQILRNFPEEWNSILDIKLWKVIVKRLLSAVDKCTLDDCARILEVCRLVNLPSDDLVPKAIARLENDVQGLSAEGFCMSLKYLVDFRAKNLGKYEAILRMLMKSKEEDKYSKRFAPNEIISVLHSVLIYNEDLFNDMIIELKELMNEYLANVDIKSYRKYTKVMKDLPPLKVIECNATQGLDELHLLIEESRKELEDKKYTIIINHFDRRLNVGEVVILNEEKNVELLILLNGKKEFMAHNSKELYRSTENNERDELKDSIKQIKDRINTLMQHNKEISP